LSREKFLSIKLFFEYDNNNEIIKDSLLNVYIKKKLFELFYDESDDLLNFKEIVEHIGYLYDLFENIQDE
jgi:hypothetical protein